MLALFRNELPELVRGFIDFVRNSQSDTISIFPGKGLRDAILEIKIYCARNDDITKLCVREFINAGFRLQDVCDEDEVGIEVETKANEYSSIHIVLKARGPSGEAHDLVPIEVQIRTSLEDVWGEIDHRLKYKEKADSASLGKFGSRGRQREREIAANLITNLKQLLDNCAGVADNIEDILNGTPVIRALTQYRGERSIGVDNLISMNVDRRYKKAISQIRDLLTGAYGMMFSGGAASAKDLKNAAGQFDEAIRSLRDVRDSYIADHSGSDNADEVFYKLTMEMALSYYWLAIIARHTGDVRNGRAMLSASDSEKLAMDTYVEVSKKPKFARDATLLYRMSSLSNFRGWNSFSLSLARDAFFALESDVRLGKNHYLRVKIPRHYGFLLWSEGFQLKRTSELVGDRGFSIAEERDLYLEALRVTLPVHCKEIEEWESDRDSKTTMEESAITANNILSYVFSYLDCGGTWNDIESAGFQKDSIRDFLEVIAPRGLEFVKSITFASTFRAAGHYLGDNNLILCGAKIVKSARESDLSFSRIDEYMFASMKKEAENDLRKLAK